MRLGIWFGTGVDLGPVLRLSLLLAQGRRLQRLHLRPVWCFPLLERLPFALRLGLDSIILLSGTLFGSFLVLVVEPYFLLAQFRVVLLILVGNAVLAALVALALGTYDRMRRQIEASYLVLRERDALERELGVARGVQRQLLPREVPDVPGLELAGICRQAIAVGGDYYDFLPLDDGCFGLVVADVSGKGVPAALLMAKLAGLGAWPVPYGGRPGDAKRPAQRGVVPGVAPPRRYATAFLATYDPETRRLSYSNAGHLPPLLVGSDDTIECAVGGFPIGLFEGATYDTGTRELASGDLLALFTDGVTEAPGPDDEEFGSARLGELLRVNREEPLDRVLDITLDALGRWSGDVPPHDDVTLVLARVR